MSERPDTGMLSGTPASAMRVAAVDDDRAGIDAGHFRDGAFTIHCRLENHDRNRATGTTRGEGESATANYRVLYADPPRALQRQGGRGLRVDHGECGSRWAEAAIRKR
jgi:hypothetical protein